VLVSPDPEVEVSLGRARLINPLELNGEEDDELKDVIRDIGLHINTSPDIRNTFIRLWLKQLIIPSDNVRHR
jgi:hypothetical protein